MLKGFKAFIAQGNVIDLAVAVVIGAAFGAVVAAVVDAVINPLIGAFVPSGDLATWTFEIPGIFAPAQFGIGAIISALINFLAVAAVVYFVFVVPMNRLKARRDARLAVPAEPEAPTQEQLLAEIRDLLAKQDSAR